jgi:hypothetical protein
MRTLKDKNRSKIATKMKGFKRLDMMKMNLTRKRLFYNENLDIEKPRVNSDLTIFFSQLYL